MQTYRDRGIGGGYGPGLFPPLSNSTQRKAIRLPARRKERNEVIQLVRCEAPGKRGHAAPSGRDPCGELVAMQARADVTKVRPAPTARPVDRVAGHARLPNQLVAPAPRG